MLRFLSWDVPIDNSYFKFLISSQRNILNAKSRFRKLNKIFILNLNPQENKITCGGLEKLAFEFIASGKQEIFMKNSNEFLFHVIDLNVN